jgi:hypothetical protein
MRVLALAGDIGSVIAQIRLVVPLTLLCRQRGWSLVLRSFHDCSQADLGGADVMVVQRANSPRVLRLQRQMRRGGGTVVYEIDDLLTEVPPHISNQASLRGRAHLLRQCMEQADLVTVSTAILGRELGAPRWQVVPNQAFEADEALLPVPRPGAPVTLLFASSERLAADFMYPALHQLPGVRLVVVGPPAADFARAGLPVEAHPLMARERFVAFAQQLPNVLAVIPLEGSRFAACKSAVKWLDYAAAGVPTLCSAVSPYLEVVTPGETGGLVANDPGAWRLALQAAVQDDGWRARIAAAAHRQVRPQFTLQHTVDAWAQAIEQARLHRASHSPDPQPFMQRMTDDFNGWMEQRLLRLRALNRARLAKRARR